MTKKEKRATTELNIELSKIATYFGLLIEIANDLPEPGDLVARKKAMLRLCDDGRRAAERAFERLSDINDNVSLI